MLRQLLLGSVLIVSIFTYICFVIKVPSETTEGERLMSGFFSFLTGGIRGKDEKKHRTENY